MGPVGAPVPSQLLREHSIRTRSATTRWRPPLDPWIRSRPLSVISQTASHFGMGEGAMVEKKAAESDTIYDRQIRLWGHDAQARLAGARVVVVGGGGLGAEVAKNVALAGCGHLAVMDAEGGACRASDLAVNFLIHAEDVDAGARRADACVARLRDMNPLCEYVALDGGDKVDPDAVLRDGKYDVVVLAADVRLHEAVAWDAACAAHGARLFAGACHGGIGYFFAGGDRGDDRASLAGVLGAPLSALPKRCAKSVVALRIVEAAGVAARDAGPEDAVSLGEVRKGMLQAADLPEPFIGEELLRDYAAELGRREGRPEVAAIVGGTLGAEVVKVVMGDASTEKPPPVAIDNLFIFDATRHGHSAGIIEKLSDGKGKEKEVAAPNPAKRAKLAQD